LYEKIDKKIHNWKIKKPSYMFTPSKDVQALQTENSLHFFPFLLGTIFACLDPDPQYEPADPIESGSETLIFFIEKKDSKRYGRNRAGGTM
jgi:hypothetical protein